MRGILASWILVSVVLIMYCVKKDDRLACDELYAAERALIWSNKEDLLADFEGYETNWPVAR